MSDEPKRPRRGSIRRRDGSGFDVLFIPTSDPEEFLTVSQDGEPVSLFPGDKLRVDIIGPGQRVAFRYGWHTD